MIALILQKGARLSKALRKLFDNDTIKSKFILEKH